MNNKIKSALSLALFLSLFNCSNAQEVINTATSVKTLNEVKKISETSIVNIEETSKNDLKLVDNVSNKVAPVLVAPVVEDSKITEKRKPEKVKSSKKIDLKAIFFDPDAEFNEQASEEGREMTKAEEFQYNIHEALHGEVSKLSTKGLISDKMRINFESGPIENISPWVDYNGYFSNIWNGANYKNTLYSINFADVGFNINMRDKKTFARVMFSPVKTYAGKNYFQTFFADNYITRKVGKNNIILVGHTWLPIGMEGKESPLVWQFFNRSQTSLNYSGARVLGAKVMGKYKYADYHVGMYSSGRGFTDWFPGPEFAGWAEFKPLANVDEKYGKLTIGTGFNAGNAQSHYAVGTGAINYEYKRLRAVTEFGIADGSNGATGFKSNKSKGINGTLSYRVTPRLQVLARCDQFDPNLDKSNDLRREYTTGLNYFIKGYAARLMLNYVMYSLEKGTYGSKILFGTQIVL